MKSINDTSRFLGISLRPWSGSSPLSLIVRGAISAAVSIAFVVIFLRMSDSIAESEAVQDAADFARWIKFVAFACVLLALWGALRLVVGVLDLLSRKTVSGVVVSVTDRRFGDSLPRLAQIGMNVWRNRRGDSGFGERRGRTEVVINTDDGLRQWTLRDQRAANKFIAGNQVTVSVTPIAGYIKLIDG